jgi:hypothetical protein
VNKETVNTLQSEKNPIMSSSKKKYKDQGHRGDRRSEEEKRPLFERNTNKGDPSLPPK